MYKITSLYQCRSKALVALCLFSAFSAQPLYAEEVKSNSSEDRIEIVVTPSRGTEQNPLDVPQAISAVTKEEISTQVFDDVDDIIRQVPGVGLAPAEGNANFWQEGFSIRGLGAQRVLTLTDGVRQAGQGIGYGGGNLSLYDPLSIEKIEILRGPASVLYGTDSFGGVLNIITREPSRRTESGSNGAFNYHFDGSRDLNRVGAFVDFGDSTYGSVIGGSFTKSEEPNLPDDEDPKSGSYKNYSIYGKADFHIDDKSKVRILANSSRTSDILVTDDTITLPIALFPPPGSSAAITSPLFFEFPRYDRHMVGVEYSATDLGENWDFFQTGVYWQRINREFHRETAFYPTGSPGFAGPPSFIDPTASVTTSVVNTDDEVNTYEWQTQSRHNFGNHIVTVGLDVGFDDSDLPETETQTVVGAAGIGAVVRPSSTISRVRADAEQRRIGLYGQDSYRVNDFEFIPGIRADFFNVDNATTDFDDDEFGVSGSLGTVFHRSADESYYLSLASGFRVPDLGERFQNGIVNLGAPTRIIGKEDLEPERAWTAEIGTKKRAGNFSYESAVYFSEIKDFIGVRALGLVDGFFTDQYDNLGNVTLYGGEAGISYAATDMLDLYANVSRTWTDDETKLDVYNWVFNYGLQITKPVHHNTFEQINTGLNFRSVLESEDLTPAEGRDAFNGGGFTVADFFFNIDLNVGEGRISDATIVSGIKNIFDKTYQEPFFALNQPERSAYVGVEFKF